MRLQSRKALKFMFLYAWKNNKKYLLCIFSEQLLLFVLTIASIIYPKWIIKYLFEDVNYTKTFISVILYILLFFFLKTFAQWFRTRFYIETYKLSKCFSMHMAEKYSKVQFQLLENVEISNLYDRTISCVYENGFFGALEATIVLIRELFVLISASIIIVNCSALVMFFTICVSIFGFMFELNLSKKNHDLEVQKITGNKIISYLDSVNSDKLYAKEIRINNLEKWIQNKLLLRFQDIKMINKKINKNEMISSNINSILSIIQMGSVYSILTLYVIKKSYGISYFTLCFNAVNQFAASLKDFFSGYIALTKMSLYIEDMDRFKDLPEMDETNCKKQKLNISKGFTFEFCNVSFKYPNMQEYAVKDLNIKISSNDKIALVGKNGAGKSTIIKLLLRLYKPTMGVILLNGTNIWDYRFEEYTEIFSAIFQDYKLLAMSIAENITCNLAVVDDKISESLKECGLYKKVEGLTDKEKTMLYREYNPNGIDLSGGETQKLAMARAIYRDAPFIIMDEPTASLDPISERNLYESFDKRIKNKTILYISHRLESVKFANTIIVMNEGNLIEIGDHNSLISMRGLYYSMYTTQAEYYKDGK